MLIVHILAGFIGIIVAPGAMLTRKGSTWHRRWGWIYVGSMGLVASTAILLALSPLNVFLLLLGVFSLYMTYSGVCAHGQRRARRIHLIDWLITTVVALCCAVLIVVGIQDLIAGISFGFVPLAFGALGLGLAGLDLAFYFRPDFSPATAYRRHLRMMIGSYIAMVSAFSAVNMLFLPPIIRWLWPTVLGAILIRIWSRKVDVRNAFKKQKDNSNDILSGNVADDPLEQKADQD